MVGQIEALEQFGESETQNSHVITVLFKKAAVDACHWVGLMWQY